MSRVERSALMPYSAEQIYALVDDIESYPRFLPWCSETRVLQSDTVLTVAEISISYHGFRRSFTTRNRKTPPHGIALELVEGPFRSLDGEWRFTELGPTACRVDFRLQYEFAGGLLDRLFQPVFSGISSSLVDAFMQRAEQLYG